jgi:hypothetical protein
MHDIVSLQVRGGLGDGGRLGLPQVDATADQALGVVDGVLAVYRGQRVPVRAIELKWIAGDRPMVGVSASSG